MSEKNQQEWTISSLQNWCTTYLKEKGFESPRLTTDLLLAYSLRCERIQLYANFDKPLAQEELTQFRALFKRRLEREPVQYIIGEAQFMGFTFHVDKRVLIPRPETEILVQEVLEVVKTQPERQFRILDIGTGSANIAVSLAHFARNIEVDAIDVSDDALAVAEMNVQRHNISSRVHLTKVDILNLPASFLNVQYDIIVSNPPYISNQEFALLSDDVKKYEPSLALNDNGDGLTFYREITKYGKKSLAQGGWIFVEIAYDQSYAVRLIYENEGYSSIAIIPDLNRIPRIIKGQKGTE